MKRNPQLLVALGLVQLSAVQELPSQAVGKGVENQLLKERRRCHFCKSQHPWQGPGPKGGVADLSNGNVAVIIWLTQKLLTLISFRVQTGTVKKIT